MSVTHRGKHPGRLWYALQNVKALGASAFHASTRKDARSGAMLGLKSTAGIGAAFAAHHYLAFVLFAPTIGAVAGGAVALYYGARAFHVARALKSTPFCRNYLRQREQEWQTLKQQGNFLTRLRKKITRFKNNTKASVLRLAKWTSYAAAGTGLGAAGLVGAHYAGVQAIAATVVPAVSNALAAAGLGISTGIAAGVAMAALPVGLVAGLACRNKIRIMIANGEIAAPEDRAPSQKPPAKPAAQNDNAPARTLDAAADRQESFNPAARRDAEQSAEQKRLAAIRREMRAARRKKT